MVGQALRWLWGLVSSVGPLIIFLLAFQFLILRRPLQGWREIALGLLLTAVGVQFLTTGLQLGAIPLGANLAKSLVEARSLPLLLVFAALLGFTVTHAEPALLAMAGQLEEVTAGALSRPVFINTVAVGVATGTVIGTIRVVTGIDATSFFIPALALVLVLTYFAPERYTALAFDAALATTGPLTVTLVVALGASIATMLGRSDTLLYGFGLVTMAAIGPIAAVLTLGIYLRLAGQ